MKIECFEYFRLDTIECGGTSLDLQDEYVHEDQGNNNGWRGAYSSISYTELLIHHTY